jgi:hypothetical protein
VATPTMTNGAARRTATPPSPPTARATSRNRTRIVVGAAVMIVSAFAAAVLYADAGDRQPYLVLTKPVAAGEVINADDLGQTLAAIDGRASAVRAADRASMVGRIAIVDLVPGALLAPSQVSDRAPEGSADAVIAARLDEGRAPADLAVGDSVLLYEVPADSDNAEVTATPIDGRVVAIEPAADGSAQIVSVAVNPGDARRAAVAAARGRITLVLAPS